MINLYDIYQGNDRIMTGVTARTVKEFGDLSLKAKLDRYYKKGFLLKGTYAVKVSGQTTESAAHEYAKLTPEEKLKSQFISKYGFENYNEWCRLNRRYGSK